MTTKETFTLSALWKGSEMRASRSLPKKSEVRASPWKSGPSGPRNSRRITVGFSPSGRFSAPNRFFPPLASTRLAVILLFACVTVFYAAAADTSPQVALNVSKAAPRTVEPLTERALVRDYKFAWANLAHAMESNSTGPLNGLFVGNASKWLNEAVDSQRNSGLSSRYLNQTHKVDAVFYAPEGDVIELHDVAEYDYEILDSGKSIHSEHATVHYVVLMTPGADRWVVRQLQSVQQF